MQKNSKGRKTWTQKLVILLPAALMCFLLYDLIEAFVSAFLPEGEVRIRLAEQQDGECPAIVIYREGYNKELFKLTPEGTINSFAQIAS